MSARAIVEIAVQDPAGARVAVDAGADRVELCQALALGGLTPSLGLIEAVCAEVGAAAVNVLIRPRAGGFVYDASEIAVVERDVRMCAAWGVGGVVVGALTRDGRLDREALRRWRDAAGAAALVFHRAIDASPHPDEVFDGILEGGVSRVLTSGGAARSIDGRARLAGYVRRSAGVVEVMAGGGVTPADVPAILDAGPGAVHLSARARAHDDSPAGPGGGVDGYDITDGAVVAAAVAASRRP